MKGFAGPVRDRWLTVVRALLPPSAPLRRIPVHVTDGRLLGGLDLAATLRAGRPVAERGILAEADDGVVVLAMAERLKRATAARLTAALDMGAVVLERDGLGVRTPTRFGVIALDEGLADDERPPAALLDRLGLHLDLSGVRVHETHDGYYGVEHVAAARIHLPGVNASAAISKALCAAAMALGVTSIRASLLALWVARVVAALAGRDEVTDADAALAGRLVLAPRATMLPAPMPDDNIEQSEPEPDARDGDDQPDDPAASADRPLEDRVLAAVQTGMPAGLLAQLRLAGGGRLRSATAGKTGAAQRGSLRGRPAGVRSGEPRAGARLNVVETLRAAAPWQRLRGRDPAARLDHTRAIQRTSRFAAMTFASPASSSARRPRQFL